MCKSLIVKFALFTFLATSFTNLPSFQLAANETEEVLTNIEGCGCNFRQKRQIRARRPGMRPSRSSS